MAEPASNKRKAPEAWLGESKSKWGRGKNANIDMGLGEGVGGSSSANHPGHWSTQEVTHGGAARSVPLEVAHKTAAGLEVYVKYLPPACTPEEVYSHFEGCGAIAGDVRLMYNHSTGNVIRGFITFETDQGFENALAKDYSFFGGRNISVTQATTTGTMQAAGTHTPAMLAEILKRLIHNPDGVYVDGTFGRGGHSRAILEKLSPQGRLHAFDVDDEAIEWGKALMKEDPRFTIHQRWFGNMAEELAPLGIEPAGVLLDIGISSPQLDGGRGFRPEMDGPLDMRFDVDHGESAWAWLQTCSREKLVQILIDYGGQSTHIITHPNTARGRLFKMAPTIVMRDVCLHPSALRSRCKTRLESRMYRNRTFNPRFIDAWMPLYRCVDAAGENAQCARRVADAIILARQGLWPACPDGIPKRSKEFAALVVAAKGKEYQKMHAASRAHMITPPHYIPA